MAAPEIGPGEQIRRFAVGQTLNPLWSMVPGPLAAAFIPARVTSQPITAGVIYLVIVGAFWAVFFRDVWRYVVVTDRRILVYVGLGLFARRRVFERQIPLGAVIGSPTGRWWRSFNTLGERMYLGPRAWDGPRL